MDQLPPLRESQRRTPEQEATVSRIFKQFGKALKQVDRSTRNLPTLNTEEDLRSMILFQAQQLETLRKNCERISISQGVHHAEMLRLGRIASPGNLQIMSMDLVDNRVLHRCSDIIAEAVRQRSEVNDMWNALILRGHELKALKPKTREKSVSRFTLFCRRFVFKGRRVVAMWRCKRDGHEPGEKFGSTIPNEILSQCINCDQLVRHEKTTNR